MRPVELEKQMLLPQYSTSRLIDRLVDEGLAARRECKMDKRGQFVEITEAGRELQKKMWNAYSAAIEKHVGSKLSDADALKLCGLLDRQPIMERGNIIGLYDVTGGGAISLEPGGQFELSGAPVETVHQTQSELMAHLVQVREIAEPLGIGFLGLGMTPSWSRAEIPLMPKGRYKIMTEYMPKVGRYGIDMMYRTCTVQTNLDFSSEADMVKKLRVSVALQPVATAMFANSPFTEGKPNGFLSFRSEIWRDTDNARSGMIPWAFEDGMGFERWVDYALDVPMYFVKRGDAYIDVARSSFRAFFEGRNNAFPGERPTLSDWANHLSTIFPEVRLKRYLEMRGADGVPWGRLPALPAFWVGLLYDDASLDAAWQIAKRWNAHERQALRDDVPRLGFKARIREQYLFEIARGCVTLSHSVVRRRGRLDHVGHDETRHVEPLERTIGASHTPAELLQVKSYGPWKGSVEPAYDEYAF